MQLKWNKLLTSVAAVSVMAGCATRKTLPDELYQSFGFFASASRQCFEKDRISAQLYADSQNAMGYILSTWEYDGARITAWTKSAPEGVNASDCKKVEVLAYQAISRANDIRGQRQIDQQALNEALKNINASFSKPIFCNRIGTMTVCN